MQINGDNQLHHLVLAGALPILAPHTLYTFAASPSPVVHAVVLLSMLARPGDHVMQLLGAGHLTTRLDRVGEALTVREMVLDNSCANDAAVLQALARLLRTWTAALAMP